MKKTLFSVILAMSVLMSSCALADGGTDKTDPETIAPGTASEDSTGTSGTQLTSDSDIPAVSEPDPFSGANSIEVIREKYPDKTILTISTVLGIADNSSTVGRANEYLSSLGKDYVIHIGKVVPDFIPNPYNESVGINDFAGDFEKVRSESDIIMAYGYVDCATNGLLLPLDEYLESSLLKDAIPQALWKCLEVDGSIYGVDCYSQIERQNGYYVNAEMADKYGFDLDKPMTEQIDVLKTIQKQEGITPILTYNQFSATAFYLGSLEISGMDCICMDSSGNIKSILEDEVYVSALEEMFILNQEGLVKVFAGEYDYMNFFAFQSPSVLPPSDHEAFDYAVFYDYEYGPNYNLISAEPFFVEVYPVFRSEPRLGMSLTAVGICSESSNADYAFDFLETAFTDPVLNNIMCFGDYEEKIAGDGRVSECDGNDKAMFFTVRGVTLPTEKQSPDVDAIFDETIQSLGNDVNANIGFCFDIENVFDENNRAIAAVVSFCDDKLLSGSYSSFDEYLSAYEQALEDAGIDAIIEEATAQYNEWRQVS